MTTARQETAFEGAIDPVDGARMRRAFGTCPWIRLRNSGHDGAVLLASAAPHIDIDTNQASTPYLFFGIITGDDATVRSVLADLSAALTREGLRHRIEAYKGHGPDPIAIWHHDWRKEGD